MIIKTECNYCKKEFDCQKKKYNHSIKKGHKLYCNVQCSTKSKFKGVIKFCNECSKEVIKIPSAIKSSKTGNVYCSKSCAAKSNNKLLRQ